MAEPTQLTMHPAVPPRRIFPRQPPHQVADLQAGPRAAGPVRVGPLACDGALRGALEIGLDTVLSETGLDAWSEERAVPSNATTSPHG
jgi:hypothetical protein